MMMELLNHLYFLQLIAFLFPEDSVIENKLMTPKTKADLAVSC